MEEQWKPIPFAPKYEASNLGRVRRGDRIKAQREFSPSKPYMRVKIHGKTKMVHRCVLAAFVGDRPELEVNHEDGNKRNNVLTNLSWCTHKANVDHAYATGLNTAVRSASSATWRRLHAEGAITFHRGEAHPQHKLNEDQVRAIRASAESSPTIAKQYGINPRTVRDIRSRKIWRHVT